MTSFYVAADFSPLHTFVVDALRNSAHSVSGGSGHEQKLPSDAIGTMAITLTNVVSGSAVQIEVQSTGVVIHNSTASSSTVSVSVPVYASGSPLNSLRIKVRKGSAAPYYRPYETLTTAIVGAQSIYVSQIPDD